MQAAAGRRAAALEPVEPFRHHLAQSERQVVGRPAPAGRARALADERDHELLHEQRIAVAGRGRPCQQVFGNRLRPGNGLRQFQALLALKLFEVENVIRRGQRGALWETTGWSAAAARARAPRAR